MKANFSLFFRLIFVVVLISAVVLLVTQPQLAVAGLLLSAVAPVLQVLFSWDRVEVPHHKVKLPMVSLAVFVGFAMVIVLVAERNLVLWLALANVGAFLLDTYWARANN